MTNPSIRRPVVDVQMTAVRGDRQLRLPDQLVGEEPMEIRVAGPRQAASPVTVTMRTPGHDFELAVGFLLAEGVVRDGRDVDSVRYCELPGGEEQQYNIVTVRLARPFDPSEVQRNFVATASCGLCGTATLEALADQLPPPAPGPVVDASMLLGLPDRLRQAQSIFERTGGLHASGLFDDQGELLVVREDVGRHNALDKVVGWAALSGMLPLSKGVLAVSGRVSYELVQKAAVAGIPIVCAVSAPSSLAVATARQVGMTLVGFVRGERANIYSGEERIRLGPSERGSAAAAAVPPDQGPLGGSGLQGVVENG